MIRIEKFRTNYPLCIRSQGAVVGNTTDSTDDLARVKEMVNQHQGSHVFPLADTECTEILL
jgi:hypothetical protein